MKHLNLLETNKCMLYMISENHKEIYVRTEKEPPVFYVFICNFVNSLGTQDQECLVGNGSFIGDYFRRPLVISSIYEVLFADWNL